MLAAVMFSLFTVPVKFVGLAVCCCCSLQLVFAVVVSEQLFNGDILQLGQTLLTRWLCSSLNRTKHVRQVFLVCQHVSPQKCKVTW